MLPPMEGRCSMRMPLHRQCRQDGSPGAWRLRVCIAYAGPQKPHKMDLGLGSSNRLMAAKRAFWMLRALLAAGWVRGAAVYAGRALRRRRWRLGGCSCMGRGAAAGVRPVVMRRLISRVCPGCKVAVCKPPARCSTGGAGAAMIRLCLNLRLCK